MRFPLSLALLWLIASSAFGVGGNKSSLQDSIKVLYEDLGLKNQLDYTVFKKTIEGYFKFKPKKPIIAIADMRLPSNKKRLFILDLKNRKLLENTWVAHGRGSGMELAERFSNEPQSYQTSPGFYSVQNKIYSPKHGLALLLDGLEKGVNHNARKREIIIHGADYVGEDFIQKYGRCGRSHGCPAVPEEKMETMVKLLANGGLLYIHPSGKPM